MLLVIASGRLGKDCETRNTNNGTSVSSFSIAVDCGFGDHKRTEWLNCILWKREGLIPHLTKGKAVTITGELQTRKWQDKQGQDRYTTEIIVNQLEFQQGERQHGQTPAQTPAKKDFECDTNDTGDFPF